MGFKKFWIFWLNKTEREIMQIGALKAYARRLWSKWKHQILSIYVGGSWVRREATEKSDIDLYIIIKDAKEIGEFAKSAKAIAEEITTVKISSHTYTLTELEDQEWDKDAPRSWKLGRTMHPKMLLKSIPEYKRLLGMEINPEEFGEIIGDDAVLRKQIRLIRWLIKEDTAERWGGEANRLRAACKWCFFAIHYEIRLRIGENVPFNRTEMVERLKDENDHIVHLINKVRKDPDAYLAQAAEIYSKILAYLDLLEQNYFKM
jgi:predicted nucleotidyltransferase